MRIAAIIPVALALMNSEAAEVARTTERHMGICMERKADTQVEQRGRALMATIFAEIGIGIERSCPGRSQNTITIAFSTSTPDRDFPGALAYAQPFAGRIRVFSDRVHNYPPSMEGRLLAYVLAHEIAHVLQGMARHSDSGIMKAHWDDHDFHKMLSMNLKFTTYDVFLIHRGIDADRSHAAQPLLTRVR